MDRAYARLTLLLCLTLTSLSSVGCERAAEQTQQQPQQPPVTDAELDAVEAALNARFDAIADERASAEATPFRLNPADARSWEDQPTWANRVLRDAYKQRQFKPRWVEPTGKLWTSAGEALYGVLKQAQADHGLSSAELDLVNIELLKSAATLPQPTPLKLEPEERKRLSAWLTQHPQHRQALGQADVQPALSQLLDADGPLTRHGVLVDRRVEQVVAASQAREELDAALSMSLLRLARTLRLDNAAWQRHREWPAELNPEKPDPKTKLELEAKRREHWAGQILRALMDDDLEPKSLKAAIAALSPPFDDYKNLQLAHAQYTKIVEAGGWPQVPETVVDLKRGASHPDIKHLKARLAAEHLWPHEERSERFEQTLTDALLEYQRTHQIWEKGVVTQETWRSLNVPARRRLMEIRQSMQQWRASRIGEDPYYVRVNIPDFHVEVWDNQKRTFRERTVTGSAARRFNRKTQRQELLHATAQFSDMMQYLVFSPYWNVPETILKEEILPALEKDPEYLTKHNYEWVETSPGQRYLRQLPGAENALGQVKFLFPNEHDIYLHDTPLKAFFDYPIRAFSHGCVRVKDPMNLAKLLLEREGRWDDAKVKSWVDGGKEVWLTLKEPVPVHIEYMVVRADEQGRAHFLMDIYRQDTEALTQHDARDLASAIAKTSLQLHRAIEPQDDELALNE